MAKHEFGIMDIPPTREQEYNTYEPENPLLVPLFVSAFRRANDLAMAMEARCYRGGDHRTRLRELRYTRLDVFGALATAAFIAVVMLEGRLLG